MTYPKLWDSTLKTLGPNSVPFGYNIANIGTSTVHLKKIIHVGPKYLKKLGYNKKDFGTKSPFFGTQKKYHWDMHSHSVITLANFGLKIQNFGTVSNILWDKMTNIWDNNKKYLGC